MHVPRPPVDLERARKALDDVTRALGFELGQLDDDPGVLSQLATDSLRQAALRTALEPDSPAIVRSLRLCARAAAAAFALGRAGRAVELPLDSDRPVRLEGDVPRSLLNASLWDQGAWAALICDDPGAFAVLAEVPISELEGSPSRGPESAYATARALRFVGAPDPLLAQKLVQSLELFDPSGMDPEDADIALRLEAPALDLMFSAVEGDEARFDADLGKALQLFEDYWEGREWSSSSLFPHALAGAARFGARRGLRIGVTSDYLPRAVLEAPWATGPVLCCPYCRTPIAEDVSVCPCCLEDPRNDALVEVTADEYRAAPREPCPSCGSLKTSRAIRCPSCRQRVPR